MTTAATFYRADYIPGANLGNVTSETQFKNSQGNLLVLTLPWNNSLSNANFYVRVSGRVISTVSLNFSVALYFGRSATIASNTQVYASGLVTTNGSSNWNIQTNLYWDATSNAINGDGQGQIANSFLGRSSIANVPSASPSQASTAALTQLGFTVTGTFDTSSAGNQAFVDNFELGLL